MSSQLRALPAILLACSPPFAVHAQVTSSTQLGPADLRVSGEFTTITSVRELSKGGLLIADRTNRLVTLFDPLTGLMENVGRVGGGPGEYSGVGWLYGANGDTTLLTDWTTGRWLVLHEGRVVNTETRPFNGLLGPRLSGTDKFGHVLALRGHPRPLPRTRADSLIVLRGHRPSQHVDTIGVIGGRGNEGFSRTPPRGRTPGTIIAANPLAAEDQALLLPDGWIAIVWTTPYRVDWRSPDGRWIRGDPLPFERVRVDDAERCFAMARMFRRAMASPCEPSSLKGWPETIPAFLPHGRTPSLFAAPDGRLIIA
jgi:hypothetical protein